jgi:hypothetical protein
MSIPTCFTKAKEFLEQEGESLSVEDLRNIARSLSEKQAQLLSDGDFKSMVLDQYTDLLERRAAARRADRMISLQKATQAKQVIRAEVQGTADIVERVNGWLDGSFRKMGDSLNKSVEAARETLAGGWFKSIRHILNENVGDLEVAERGMLDKEVMQELDALQKGGQSGVSGNAVAARIAEAYHQVLSDIFRVKQAFDPYLGKIQDYFYRATHDPAKVAKGREEWVKFVAKRYSKNSFPELVGEEKIAAFGAVYDDIVAGTHSSSISADFQTGNLMQRMARNRVLIPDDWQAFHEYNQTYGRTNMHTTMLDSIMNASSDIAVIQKFGANPKETFDTVMRMLKKDATPEELKLLKTNSQAISEKFEGVVQRSPTPITENRAKIARGLAKAQSASKLGAVWLSSWGDLANFVTAISDLNGENYLVNVGEAMKAYGEFFRKSPEARLDAMEKMNLFQKSVFYQLSRDLGEPVTAGLNYGDKVTGGLNKMIELQSHLSLANRHRMAIDAAMATVVSRELGRLSEVSYGELLPQAQQALRRYGIDAKGWEVLRHATEDWTKTLGEDAGVGRIDKMMTIEAVENIPTEKLASYVKASGLFKGEGEVPASMIERARTDLKTAIGTMTHQMSSMASSSAGQAEYAKMFGNVNPNSWHGVALNLVLQFKSAMLKNYDTIMRSFYSNPARPNGDYMKITRHMALAMTAYTAQKTLRALIEGKTPDDPTRPGFIADAITSSGIGGMVGDALVTELFESDSAYDVAHKMLQRTVGPTISSAFDVAGILAQSGQSLVDGNTHVPYNQMGKVITQNLPFQNLFYTKSLYNYFISNGIRSYFDNGFMFRLNKPLNRQHGMLGTDQEYYMNIGNQSAWE